MTAPENPMAFPSAIYGCTPEGGMTLRDYFAARAPEPPPSWWGSGERTDCPGYAMWAYQYADAMLAARAIMETE